MAQLQICSWPTLDISTVESTFYRRRSYFIAGIWGVWILLGSLIGAAPDNICVMPFGGCIIRWEGIRTSPFRIVVNGGSLVIWVLSLLLICYCYTKILKLNRRFTASERRSNLKSIQLIVLISVIFFIGWMPSIAIAILYTFGNNSPNALSVFAQIMLLSNSFLNICVYGSTNKQYKNSSISLLRHLRRLLRDLCQQCPRTVRKAKVSPRIPESDYEGPKRRVHLHRHSSINSLLFKENVFCTDNSIARMCNFERRDHRSKLSVPSLSLPKDSSLANQPRTKKYLRRHSTVPANHFVSVGDSIMIPTQSDFDEPVFNSPCNMISVSQLPKKSVFDPNQILHVDDGIFAG